jgi:hypothetical protein
MAFPVLLVTYVIQRNDTVRLSKTLIGITPLLGVYYVYYSANGFPPHETYMSFILSRTQNINPFSVDMLKLVSGFVTATVITLILFSRMRVAKSLTRSLKESPLLPIYVFLLLYSPGLFVHSFGYQNFWHKIFQLITFSKPRFKDLSILRYSTIPISMLAIPVSVKISQTGKRTVRRYLSPAIILLLILLNPSFGSFYSRYQSIPESYVESSVRIKENWDGGTIVVDNQFLIYQLTGVGDVPPDKVLGSFWARDLTNMENSSVSQIVFTSIPWDGARVLFEEESDERFQLVFSQQVVDAFDLYLNRTVYVYQIDW